MAGHFSNYSFTGNFKEKRILPQENLSHQRNIQKLRNERKNREILRKQTEAVTKIQALVRSALARHRIKVSLRNDFDIVYKQLQGRNHMTSVGFTSEELKSFQEIIPKANLFFTESEPRDVERMVWICQELINLEWSKKVVSSGAMFEKESTFPHFLSVTLRCLRALAGIPQSRFSPPLRLLEMFAFTDFKIAKRILDEGYFKVIRVLLEAKGSNPVGDGIVQSLLLPLTAAKSLGIDAISLTYFRMCEALFCPELSGEIVEMALPAIIKSIPKKIFSVEEFVMYLNEWCSADSVSMETETLDGCSFKLQPSPSLAFALLSIISSNKTVFEVKSLSDDGQKALLSCMGEVIPELRQIFPLPVKSSAEDEMMDTSPAFSQDYDEFPSNSKDQKNAYILVKCGNSLNDGTVVNFLLDQIRKDSLKRDEVESLIRIASLVQKMKSVTSNDFMIIHQLSLNGDFIKQLWRMVMNCKSKSIFGGPGKSMIEELQNGEGLTEHNKREFIPLMSLFCTLFSNLLLAVDDSEFYRKEKPLGSLMPFNFGDLKLMSKILRDMSVGMLDLAFPDTKPDLGAYNAAITRLVGYNKQQSEDNNSSEIYGELYQEVVRLVVLLHEKESRLQFGGSPTFWVATSAQFMKIGAPSLNKQMFRSSRRNEVGVFRNMAELWVTHQLEEKDERFVLSPSEMKTMTVLRQIPFVIHFDARVKMLQELINADKRESGRMREDWGGPSVGGNSIHVFVRRTHLYEDALDKLSPGNEPNLKPMIRVQMANWAGLDEAGIDGGGIFREFLSKLLEEGFAPDRGLFKSTPHEGLLYPNPLATAAFPDDFKRHYYFLGRMLGKLLYENQLAELRFASFFLIKLLGKNHSKNLDVHHLKSYDPVLYQNLMSLKEIQSEAEWVKMDLNLTFCAQVVEFGVLKVVDLRPGGRSISVNFENKLDYIQLMANFYLNQQIREQTSAFLSGLSELIDLDWLGMFDHREFQTLISGVDKEIDIHDLRQYTVYGSGGYESDSIRWFWQILEEFSPLQKQKFLKFVTSCSRPPLLGFKDLYPPMCVQLVPEMNRLPTAATCMNLLKLPMYETKEMLKAKLLYSLEQGSEGFELS